MKQQHFDPNVSTPFLAKYASERTESAEMQGRYCSKVSMWVVDHKGEETSLIDVDTGLVELVTKTRTQQESDDQEGFSAMAELETKTNSRIEHDNADLAACQEMATKTDAQMESDDTSIGTNGMFL
jgi:hypothetical protein